MRFINTNRRNWRSYSALAIAALLGCGIYFARHLQHKVGNFNGARLTSAAVTKAVEKSCADMGLTCQIVTGPTFIKESSQKSLHSGKDDGISGLWSVTCETNGRRVEMLLDDKTANLRLLVGEEACQPYSAKHTNAVSIDNAREATQMAVYRMKSLRLLPQGSQIALEEPPSKERMGRAWHMRWLIRDSVQCEPRHLTFVMDRFGGIPLCVVGLKTFGLEAGCGQNVGMEAPNRIKM